MLQPLVLTSSLWIPRADELRFAATAPLPFLHAVLRAQYSSCYLPPSPRGHTGYYSSTCHDVRVHFILYSYLAVGTGSSGSHFFA